MKLIPKEYSLTNILFGKKNHFSGIYKVSPKRQKELIFNIHDSLITKKDKKLGALRTAFLLS